MSGKTSTHPALPARFRVYLALLTVANIGSAAVALTVAILASKTGESAASAARTTAIVVSVNLLATAIVVPYSTWIASKLGTVRTVFYFRTLNMLVLAAVGVLLVMDFPVLPVLYANAALLGLTSGVLGPLRPLMAQAFSGLPLADTSADMRLSSGAAAAIGALMGGVVVGWLGAPTVFLMAALLFLPLVVFLGGWAPHEGVEEPVGIKRPWRTLFNCLGESPRLRSAVWLGLASVILLGPLYSMFVPILRQLGHTEEAKAGLLLALIAVGQMVTPFVVKRLQRGHTSLLSATRALQVCGAAFLLLAFVESLPTAPTLVLLGVIALLFGAVFFSVTAFLFQAATEGATSQQRGEYLAAYLLITGLGAPIGTMLWGHALDLIPWEIFFVVVSLLTALVVPMLLRQSLRADEGSTASPVS